MLTCSTREKRSDIQIAIHSSKVLKRSIFSPVTVLRAWSVQHKNHQFFARQVPLLTTKWQLQLSDKIKYLYSKWKLHDQIGIWTLPPSELQLLHGSLPLASCYQDLVGRPGENARLGECCRKETNRPKSAAIHQSPRDNVFRLVKIGHILGSLFRITYIWHRSEFVQFVEKKNNSIVLYYRGLALFMKVNLCFW